MMSYNSQKFGIVLSRLRTEKGLSQEQLSGLAGISRSHLAMIENGRKTPRLDTLWRLAEALDIMPSQILELAETEDHK